MFHRKVQSHLQTPPSEEEKGLVTVERFLGCAESAVLDLGKPIKLQYLITHDLHMTLYKTVFYTM